jgi:acetyl-CoA carboxylase biotin carboxyl carrier protein
LIPWNTFHSLGQLLQDGELEEIELENESYRIKLNRSVSSGAPVAAPTESSAAEGTGGEEATGGDSSEDNWIEITSPMVGTFYKAPAPDADPFVEVGDQIEEGETVCIIEAMKLMNEIEADNPGTIQKVCCENAEPVSKGDVLFYLEPA